MKMENSYEKLRKTDFPKNQLQYIHNVKRCEYENYLKNNGQKYLKNKGQKLDINQVDTVDVQ